MRTLSLVLCLALVVACAPASVAPPQHVDKKPQRTGRMFACDNYEGLGATPEQICFPPHDPKFMTIGLYPGLSRGTPQRIKDPGNGIRIVILKESANVVGDSWYRVESIDGRHRGWIGAHMVRLD